MPTWLGSISSPIYTLNHQCFFLTAQMVGPVKASNSFLGVLDRVKVVRREGTSECLRGFLFLNNVREV